MQEINSNILHPLKMAQLVVHVLLQNISLLGKGGWYMYFDYNIDLEGGPDFKVGTLFLNLHVIQQFHRCKLL